eukprot:15553569-Heterocapsa_arctica.AAC.1
MEAALELRQEQRRQEVLRGKPQGFKRARYEVGSWLVQFKRMHRTNKVKIIVEDYPGANK